MFHSIEDESISKVFIYFSNFRSSGGVPVLPMQPTVGLLSLPSLLDRQPSLLSLLTYRWASFTVEPTELQMGYLHCRAY